MLEDTQRLVFYPCYLMLEFPRGKPKTPFIADQRIWYLKADENLARRCLEPDLFALAREVRKTDRDGFAKHQMPAGCEWVEVANRGNFLIDPGSRLLCLTIDAGIGKTTAMIQTQTLRGAWLPGHLVIATQFDHLPDSADRYLGVDGWLVTQFVNEFPHQSAPNRLLVWQLIQRKLATKQFTLIVDSLDQISRPDPQRRAQALAQFLGHVCSEAQAVVSGRPQSIQLYWNVLFEQCGPWKFAQIDQFSPKQQERYLGERRAKLLKRLEADVVSNPRMLEMILKVPDADLPKIQTAADIYWRAINETLKEDIRSQGEGSMKREPALFWFSLLAFESLRQGYFNGVPEGKPIEMFLKAVLANQEAAIEPRLQRARTTFDAELQKLGKLNSFILHAVLDSSETLKQLKFRDRSMQDFFAALWISKYACTPTQQTWLLKKLRQQIQQENAADDPEEKEFIQQRESQLFRLAAGMPIDAIEDGEIWAGSMSVVYELSGTRATELIYRCWPNLLRLAGYSTPEQIFEMQQIEPTTRAQREVRAWVDQLLGQHPTATPEALQNCLNDGLQAIQPIAKQVLYRFLSEFPAMLHGAYGAEKQRIASDFDGWFVPVPEQKGAELVFSTTNDSGKVIHIEISEPFLMAKYQVTNELYGLFFRPAGHLQRIEDDPVKRARCAAANINWYDAWSAALFFMGRLPSEDEWEFACRGRPGQTPDPYQWCFGNEQSELKKYALYHQQLDHFSEKVGQRLPWAGLYDMHGNIWEWCSTWFSLNRDQGNSPEFIGITRCLRGGSFYDNAKNCSCAYDFQFPPFYANRCNGFRIARSN